MPKQLPEVAEQYRGVARGFYRTLDDVLGERSHLAGDEFTMADILALCTLDFAAGLNSLPPDPKHEHVARWHAAVSARPSARA